ncbi:GmrSD restriction endonuclease domain-containing protein [Treponema ruminis]|uniref:Uncharacterized protein with ParB-like and HNH nuclease domain n=1 Tax=Treponema ruminis TaxID=744515 RepID=A0A7W8G6W0_9SPIR|nr:DUF262 domain-containing protein [Treponema ruminis]MBB5224910.1 uncharacterized protein with ParB-like and HNH nuclease domain [Treponema ruminis]
MSNLIYSVKEIFTDYLNDNNFNIPEYQRGYKWTKEDAKNLLDDLEKFEAANKDSNSFYCLQNITIVPEKNILNVVDGQQRLTTLYILLSYLKYGIEKNEIPEFKGKLEYSIRKTTGDFLKTDLITNNFWNNEVDPSKSKYRDEYYIREVAKAIKDWFALHSLSTNTILNRLKLIVNKLDGKAEETIFANINGGKVPLDGADLVRAILMTKSAKEKFAEFKSIEKTNEFRVRMGMELDEINRWWSNKDVKTYFEQFLPNSTENDTNFNQDNFPINLLYKLFYEIYKNQIKDEKGKTLETQTAFSFKFFEYGTNFDDNSKNDYYEMYQKILSLHLTLKDWYNHQQIYHLLGYLVFNFKENGVSLKLIWEIWNNSSTKQKFIQSLKNLITEKLLNLSDQKNKNQEIDNLKKQITSIDSDWYDSNLTEKLLPLMDVIHYLEPKRTERLRVDYFRLADEDKEHIMCQHPRNDKNEIITRSKSEVEKYLDSLFKNGSDEKKDTEKLDELKKLLPINNNDEVSIEIQEEIDKELHKYCLNSIGNIVLLNNSVNRSYSNALYNEKVTRIVSEFFNPKVYIRPFTASVFLQKDSKTIKDNWHWGIKEIQENANNISKKISEFLGWENK